ncbi:MAG: helix-turn-helix domain-containing protein, partial [Aliifodinibius sp.]|nr:helix-turn-helix domain-containing protein [Fodinibius sp.]
MIGEIGKRIKQLLKSSRQTQKQLSISTGIPESTLSEIIHGKKDPSISKIKTLAEFFNVDLNWLVSGKPFEKGEQTMLAVAESGQAKHYLPSNSGEDRKTSASMEANEQTNKYIPEIVDIL